jgi:uncharacterized phage-associated protein
MAHDVRSLANWVLDRAEEDQCALSNMALNKVIFFLHAYYLVRFERPLISAKIEAWQYGPVIREIFHAFKVFGDKPITSRATKIVPDTGQREVCAIKFPTEEREFLESIATRYMNMSASALMNLSHEKGGPWDLVWNHPGQVNSSMRISDEIIRDWYKQSLRH